VEVGRFHRIQLQQHSVFPAVVAAGVDLMAVIKITGCLVLVDSHQIFKPQR
jgi:hypothetical protein